MKPKASPPKIQESQDDTEAEIFDLLCVALHFAGVKSKTRQDLPSSQSLYRSTR